MDRKLHGVKPQASRSTQTAAEPEARQGRGSMRLNLKTGKTRYVVVAPKVTARVSPTPVTVSPAPVHNYVNPTPVSVNNNVSPSPVNVQNHVSPSPVRVENHVSPTPINITNSVEPAPVQVFNDVRPSVNVEVPEQRTPDVYVSSESRGRSTIKRALEYASTSPSSLHGGYACRDRCDAAIA